MNFVFQRSFKWPDQLHKRSHLHLWGPHLPASCSTGCEEATSLKSEMPKVKRKEPFGDGTSVTRIHLFCWNPLESLGHSAGGLKRVFHSKKIMEGQLQLHLSGTCPKLALPCSASWRLPRQSCPPNLKSCPQMLSVDIIFAVTAVGTVQVRLFLLFQMLNSPNGCA